MIYIHRTASLAARLKAASPAPRQSRAKVGERKMATRKLGADIIRLPAFFRRSCSIARWTKKKREAARSLRPYLQLGRVTLALGLPSLARGLKIARLYKQNFTGRVTLLPGTTQTGLASINLVNKHATDNKFSAEIIFHFLSSLKFPDTTFLKFGARFDGKTINNSVSEYFSDSSHKCYIEYLVAKSRYSKIISF